MDEAEGKFYKEQYNSLVAIMRRVIDASILTSMPPNSNKHTETHGGNLGFATNGDSTVFEWNKPEGPFIFKVAPEGHIPEKNSPAEQIMNDATKIGGIDYGSDLSSQNTETGSGHILPNNASPVVMRNCLICGVATKDRHHLCPSKNLDDRGFSKDTYITEKEYKNIKSKTPDK